MITAPGSRTSTPPLDAGHDVLVTSEWLAAHLFDATVRVVEVDVSRADYDQGHIDGAVLWNVYSDMKDPDYRLIEAAGLERLTGRSGIGRDTTVVFYGYAPALGFWLMKLYGHADVRILDCSRAAWLAEGRPWSSSATEQASIGYRLARADGGLRADHSAVHDAIGRSGITLADVRSEAEYRGERFWPSGGMEPNGRAGHVPSAIHQPIDGLYDEYGSFRPSADLRGVFSSIDLDGDGEILTYCTIGGRAATAWFVLTYLLGREQVRVYDGSWAEWGRMTSTPVQRP